MKYQLAFKLGSPKTVICYTMLVSICFVIVILIGKNQSCEHFLINTDNKTPDPVNQEFILLWLYLYFIVNSEVSTTLINHHHGSFTIHH